MRRHIPALVAALAIVPVAPARGLLAWTPRTITAKDKRAKRIGREKNVYAVTAYVRRIKLRESDGDWHLDG